MEDVLKFVQVLVIPMVGLILFLLWLVWDQGQKAVIAVKKDATDAATTALNATNSLRDKVQQFEVKVASEYVHINRMDTFENRILSAIQRLEDQIMKQRSEANG
jgi:hypothetical protein